MTVRMKLYTVQDEADPNVMAICVAENEEDAEKVIAEAHMPPLVSMPKVELLDIKLLKRTGRQVLWARWLV